VTADAIGDNCDMERVTERPTVADALAADARVGLWSRRYATCRAKEVTGDGVVTGAGDHALLIALRGVVSAESVATDRLRLADGAASPADDAACLLTVVCGADGFGADTVRARRTMPAVDGAALDEAVPIKAGRPAG
jgi:hypothetical protein